MVSEAQKKATSKYISKAYDQVSLRMPKGKREEYKAHAERQGKSLNALIIELLEKICRSIKPLHFFINHFPAVLHNLS